jgi:hypothetical protein
MGYDFGSLLVDLQVGIQPRSQKMNTHMSKAHAFHGQYQQVPFRRRLISKHVCGSGLS